MSSTSKAEEPEALKASGEDKPTDTDKGNETKLNVYPNKRKAESILGSLVSQRETGEFCDVQLKLSPGYTVNAHKAILSACSAYFEGMFTSTFLEATSNTVDLSHIVSNTDSLENVINSFYGIQFEIDENNVGEVMNLATMFLVDDLRDLCAQVMSKTISVQNAAEMMQLAFNFQIEDLKTRVKPVITARFHDYIMFQEDLVDMGTECFDYVLSLAHTENVSRKGDYIKLILNWFSASEGDERAAVAIKGLIKYRNFLITNQDYREVETEIQEVIEHMQEVNSDVSEDVRYKFTSILKRLKPYSYDKDESNESDLEEDVPVEYLSHVKLPFIGPRTKTEGYTEEEEKAWLKQHANIAEYERLEKIWQDHKDEITSRGLKFSLTQISDEGAEIYSKRQRLAREYDVIKEEFRDRNIRPKTRQQLEEESKLLDCVIVLAPSSDYLKTDILTADEDNLEDIMYICMFVPKKRAWYKLGTLSSTGFKSKVESGSGGGRSSSAAGGSADWREGMDDMDIEEMEEMMFMYAPEMMMMEEEDMPSRYRRRMMEDMMRNHRMPSHRMRHMMRGMMGRDRDDSDDDEDMGRHRHSRMMMMRMMGRPVFDFGKKLPKSSVKSLLKGKWKMTYYKQRLFFYYVGLYNTIWCYSILDQDWKEFTLDTKGTRKEKDQNTKHERADGLEVLVSGQTLYAVILLALVTTESNWSNRDDYGSKSVDVKYKIMKLSETDKFEFHYETKTNMAYVERDQFEEDTRPEEQKKYSVQQTPLKQGVFKMVIFCEDDQMMDIFLLVRSEYPKRTLYKLGFLCMAYLDVLESVTTTNIPYDHCFLREFTPLVFDNMLSLVDDDLRLHTSMNLARIDGLRSRNREYKSREPEKTSAFHGAEAFYPKCPIVIANNRHTMWVIEGRERDISEMTEVKPVASQTYAQREAKKTPSVPPPFRAFALACAGQTDRDVVRRYNPPTKYLHV